jgi:hypothetical protein
LLLRARRFEAMDVAHRPTGPAEPDGTTLVPPVLAVVGEHHDDPDRLLLLGEDGRHYEYQLSDGTTIPVVPDEAWVIDTDHATIEGTLSVTGVDTESM